MVYYLLAHKTLSGDYEFEEFQIDSIEEIPIEDRKLILCPFKEMNFRFSLIEYVIAHTQNFMDIRDLYSDEEFEGVREYIKTEEFLDVVFEGFRNNMKPSTIFKNFNSEYKEILRDVSVEKAYFYLREFALMMYDRSPI